MTRKGLKLLVILFMLWAPTQAQSNIPSSKLIPFQLFIGKNFNIPQSIKYDCTWNYVMIKAETDDAGKITSYSCLNEIPDSLAKSFKFLVGYQFSKALKINKRPIVFYASFENDEICTTPASRQYLPNQVIDLIFERLKRQMDEQPNSIILYTPQVFKYQKTQY